jgi:hypothetical protein
MNERIRQLAVQAEKLSLQYANKNNINFVDAFNIVFAELIVLECIKAVNPDTEYPMESVDVVEEFHRGYWVGCNDSTMRIKDYFGVEE